MDTASRSKSNGEWSNKPVIGHLLLGGSLSRALIRDIRLANGLADRGYEVHAFWTLDRTFADRLDKRIKRHWFFTGLRYYPFRPVSGLARNFRDQLAQCLEPFVSIPWRQRFFQRNATTVDGFLQGMLRVVCEDVNRDPTLVVRFGNQLRKNRISHVMSQFAVLCPWIVAARERLSLQVKYFPTFQGYELYANYAKKYGLEDGLYRALRRVVEMADFPSVAVSKDYCKRICEELSISNQDIVTIPPGIELPGTGSKSEAKKKLEDYFPALDPSLPLVTFFGRQDSEKGVDILLYAAALLRKQGVKFQLAVVGPTLFGDGYAKSCKNIARNLRLGVFWESFVSDRIRECLYLGSEVVVCPSINREPFGMVAAEAMGHGTPVVVSDQGGIAELIGAENERGGVSFRSWDSGDLARKLKQLLSDTEFRDSLGKNAAVIAKRFSVDRMVDKIAAHMNLPNIGYPLAHNK
jgi:glycosyltransferase involved in cell wall biosynthesis